MSNISATVSVVAPTVVSQSESSHSGLVATSGGFFSPWDEPSTTNVIAAVSGQEVLGGRCNTPHRQQPRHGVRKIHRMKKSKLSRKKSKNPTYSIDRRQQRENDLLHIQGAHEFEFDLQEEIVDDPPQIAEYILPIQQESEQFDLSQPFSCLRYLHNLTS